MDLLVYILKLTLTCILDVLQIAMIARAIFSWFDPTGESRFGSLLYFLTEPVITPVRRLCEKLHWFEGVPVDIPFLITMILLSVIQVFLSFL